MRVRLVHVAVPLGLLFAIAGATMFKIASDQTVGTGQGNYFVPTRYEVTPAMIEAAASLKRTPAPSFQLFDSHGAQVNQSDFKKGKPTALVFISYGCACSIEAQVFFNDLANAYGNDAQFFGVIDTEAERANQFAQSNSVPFRMICDPTKGMIADYRLEASASMALIDGNGQIVEVWPGYNRAALRRLNFLLGALSKTSPREFDDRDAPEALTSGCAFF